MTVRDAADNARKLLIIGHANPERHMRPMIAGAVASFVCFSASAAQVQPRAERRDTTVFRVSELVVQALRPVATRWGASALEVQLDSLRTRPAVTLEQVLRELPFVQVRTNPRGEGYFTLRGSGADAREVAVLVDGIPLSLGFDHRADLAVLPASGAETLSLVRGIPSLLYGPNVLGGVVEIGIANGAASRPSHPALQVSGGVDHTGASALSGSIAVPHKSALGTLVVRAGGAHRASDGFPLPADVREPAPFADADLRVNSDREHSDGFVAARLEGAKGPWLAVSTSAYSATRGTPAELHIGNPRFWRYPEVRRSFSVASAGTGEHDSPLGGLASLQASVGFDVGRTELDGFTTRQYDTVLDQEDADDRNRSLRVLGSHTLLGIGELQAAFTVADVTRDEVLTPGGAAKYRQRLWSAAAETGWRIGAAAIGLSTLRFSAGLAHDVADTPETGGKPETKESRIWGARAGLTGVTAGGRVLLHAGASRRARFPSLRELYSGALNRVEPNPELGPEVLFATEAGVTAQIGVAQLQLVGFRHEIKDAIVRTTTPQRRVKRVNRDQTRATGLELLGSARIAGASVSADVTAQLVESENPLTEEEFRTEYQPKLAGGTRVIAPIVLGVRADAALHVVGSQYCLNTTGGYARIERSTKGDLELSRRWSAARITRGWFDNIHAGIAVDNLTDGAIYDQCGLPQAGRVARVTLRFR